MPGGLLILTTAPDAKTAGKIARRLVSEKAAACVTVLDGARSTYRWKGKVESARESLLLVKTAVRRYAKVEKLIRASHPYEVPEVVSIRWNRASSRYAAWLEQSIQ